jgi:hypothetical protein
VNGIATWDQFTGCALVIAGEKRTCKDWFVDNRAAPTLPGGSLRSVGTVS